SENIRVHAIIDRFLEHARIVSVENGGAPEVYCGSSDWMPRNFRRRVEVLFPLVDPQIRTRVTEGILKTMSSDNVKGWELASSGRYQRVFREEATEAVRSQEIFMGLARKSAHIEAPGLGHQDLRLAPVRQSTL